MDGQEHSAVPMHSQLAVSMWISKHNVRISVYTEITAFLCWDLMNILRIHLCDFLAQNYDEERVMAPEIIMNYYYTHFRPIANIYIYVFINGAALILGFVRLRYVRWKAKHIQGLSS